MGDIALQKIQYVNQNSESVFVFINTLRTCIKLKASQFFVLKCFLYLMQLR